MISRFRKSLGERGLVATVRLARRRLAAAAARLVDRHFDWAFGTDTRTMIENADLSDVKSSNLARGIRYEPTLAIPFRRALRAARVPSAGTFVDIGCGKGRACMLAVVYGFADVTGVDYSPALCRIAERNLDLFRARTHRRFRSGIRSMDASDYAFAPGDTVVYLFNPFDAGVLSAVMARLRRSLSSHPREVWIVYQNPRWRSAIESGGDFARVGDWTYGGCDFAVYRSRFA
jgi:SAM-dependent methyltransferase